MVKPVKFTGNLQTAESNSFQQQVSNDAQEQALKEFNGLVEALRAQGIEVWDVEDTEYPHTPDSIFPNNWISTHEDGMIGIYPMLAENRRKERRADIVSNLGEVFQILDMHDYSAEENNGRYLEGTGSMVLDREHKICYACLSPRTDEGLISQFCTDFGYTPVTFVARDRDGHLIYHTNVLMCVGEKFMVVCMECIETEAQKEAIKRSAGNKEMIEISLDQVHHFAGNMLELVNAKGEHILVMSEQAYLSLSKEQVATLSSYATILHPPLYTIESNGGGSARCMIAELFLPWKKNGNPDGKSA